MNEETLHERATARAMEIVQSIEDIGQEDYRYRMLEIAYKAARHEIERESQNG